ncbi:SPOC like C-terminal domain-containing protein [Mycena floridula]|nr:SPOC like C-terminal domain-containing protein [Mycena floridula]
MGIYDGWNKDSDEEDELQDMSHLDYKKDVILFCIDCSPSMMTLRDHPEYEDVQTCHLFEALHACMQIQKKKVIVGPNDSVGIILFNTSKKPASETEGQGSEIKAGTYLYQPISPINAPTIRELRNLLEDARENPQLLREMFPPMTPSDKRVPMGDVFTSCNWVLRDGAPKTATKRVFLITDQDNPHPGTGSKQLITSAKTTLDDLTHSGCILEPFFISTEDQPFDVNNFYSSVLLPGNLNDDDDDDDETKDRSILPESISISRIEDLLAQMRFREVPKRAQFSLGFELAAGLTIGVKGYGLVTEQKKGAYKYFVDLGDRLALAEPKTSYMDEEEETEVSKTQLMFGPSVGAAGADDDGEGEHEKTTGFLPVIRAPPGKRPLFTAEEVRSFRAVGLEPSIKLLGFKNEGELLFEDNVKHSLFIYPDEMSYSGSKRTFSALLKSLVKKKKIGLVLALTRRNSSPSFCALVPQEERVDAGGWTEPPGFHLIPLPFADDIRAAPVETALRANDDLKDLARAWLDKLCIKNGTYQPDSYPNPALAYHNAQLEARAFQDEFDPDSFEDLTEPRHDIIHKRAGNLLQKWKDALEQDDSANMVAEADTRGTKRKAEVSVDDSEIRSRVADGTLTKLRVDQLKDFLKKMSQPVSGKKADLMERVEEYVNSH